MTKHMIIIKLPALLAISFILSAHAFIDQEEDQEVIRRSVGTADTSNGHVHQAYLDLKTGNNVSQNLVSIAASKTDVDERSYLRTSSGEQRRSLSFWSSIMSE